MHFLLNINKETNTSFIYHKITNIQDAVHANLHFNSKTIEDLLITSMTHGRSYQHRANMAVKLNTKSNQRAKNHKHSLKQILLILKIKIKI